MNTEKLFKDYIKNSLKLVKKSRTINGLNCIERGGYKKATLRNIEKMIDKSGGFNLSLFNMSLDLKNFIISHEKKSNTYRVFLDGDIKIFISTENGRFCHVDVFLSDRLKNSIEVYHAI